MSAHNYLGNDTSDIQQIYPSRPSQHVPSHRDDFGGKNAHTPSTHSHHPIAPTSPIDTLNIELSFLH